MDGTTADRIYPPTPKRRQQARAEGRVAKSSSLTAAVVTVGGLGLLWQTGSALFASLSEIARRSWSTPWLSLDAAAVSRELLRAGGELGWATLPLLAGVLALAVVVELCQTGLLFLPQKLAPQWDRMASGGQRFVSSESWWGGLLTCAKLTVLAGCAYFALRHATPDLLSLTRLEPHELAGRGGELIFRLLMQAAVALLLVAGGDYLFRYWKHERDLRMTADELREEQKAGSGNPALASRRKTLQRKIAGDRQTEAVDQVEAI